MVKKKLTKEEKRIRSRESERRYRSKDKNKWRKYHRKYYLKRKRYFKKYHKVYYRRNKKDRLKYQRVYYSKNKEKEYQYNLVNKDWIKEKRIKKYRWFRKNRPWHLILKGIKGRVGRIERYKKIKNFLTEKDIKNLWYRDKAFLMKNPHLHRKESKGHYAIENCKFLRGVEHIRLHNKERGVLNIKNGKEE